MVVVLFGNCPKITTTKNSLSLLSFLVHALWGNANFAVKVHH